MGQNTDIYEKHHTKLWISMFNKGKEGRKAQRQVLQVFFHWGKDLPQSVYSATVDEECAAPAT